MLNRIDLESITGATLAHYQQRAAEFCEGTRDHDVTQNIDALLRHIAGPPPFTILDFGCGPGRDLKTFTRLGHRAIGLDGAERFVAMAREESGCEVWQQDFLALALPAEHFDGVFANAALFHVPTQELPRVLRQLHRALKPRGVLFSSNPRGANEEGWKGARYGAFHDLAHWCSYLEAAGFLELEHYYRPAGLPCEQQPWLASVWRRASQATADARSRIVAAGAPAPTSHRDATATSGLVRQPGHSPPRCSTTWLAQRGLADHRLAAPQLAQFTPSRGCGAARRVAAAPTAAPLRSGSTRACSGPAPRSSR